MKNLWVIIILFNTVVFGQDKGEKPIIQSEIMLGTGYSQTYFKDLAYSPLNYKGNSPSFILKYNRKSQKYKWYINADFSSAIVSSKASRLFDANFYLANLEIGYLHKVITSSDKKLKFFTGGQLHSANNLLFFEGDKSISFYTLHSLDLSAELNYHLNKNNSFCTKVNLSRFGYLVRPAYTIFNVFIVENRKHPEKIIFNGDWASLNRFFVVNWQFGYKYSISNRFDITIENMLRYYQTSVPDKAIIFNNQTNLGVIYKF